MVYACFLKLRGDINSGEFEENLVNEIINAARRRGTAYKRKQALCKEYIENKINIRFLR